MEAKLAGIKLVCRDENNKNRLIYECCLCEDELISVAISSVRRVADGIQKNKFMCTKCARKSRLQDYKKKLVSDIVRVIDDDEDHRYFLYEFKICGHQQRLPKSDVKTEEIKCEACYLANVQLEAKSRGLRFLTKETPSNRHYLYEHLSCGHKCFLMPTVIKASLGTTKAYPCTACLRKRRVNEALEAGLVLYGTSNRPKINTSAYLYKAPCGHIIEKRVASIQKKVWECQACIEEAFQSQAKYVGLSLVGNAGGKKGTRTYQFEACQHVQDIPIGAVKRGNFHCRRCCADKLTEVLALRGLKKVGTTDSDQRYLFEIIECGHIQEMALSNAKLGSYICHECNNTYYDNPSSVYLYRISVPGADWLKLGFAKHPDVRHEQYGLPDIADVELLDWLPTQTGRDARHIESILHRDFKQHVLSSEEMRDWHTKSGYTECYPVELEEKLMRRISSFREN